MGNIDLMSQKDKSFTPRQKAQIYAIVLLEVVALLFIIPSSQSTGETPPTCVPVIPPTCTSGQILFDTKPTGSVPTNSSVITQSFTPSQNDLIVLSTLSKTVSLTSITTVVSVLDNHGTAFTQQIRGKQTDNNSTYDLELWTGFYKVSGLDSITVTWNSTVFNGFLSTTYSGAFTVGNSGFQATLGSTGNINLTITHNDDWIIAGTLWIPCSSALDNTFLGSNNRGDYAVGSCQPSSPFNGGMFDRGPIQLLSSTNQEVGSTWPSGSTKGAIVALELEPLDQFVHAIPYISAFQLFAVTKTTGYTGYQLVFSGQCCQSNPIFPADQLDTIFCTSTFNLSSNQTTSQTVTLSLNNTATAASGLMNYEKITLQPSTTYIVTLSGITSLQTSSFDVIAVEINLSGTTATAVTFPGVFNGVKNTISCLDISR